MFNRNSLLAISLFALLLAAPASATTHLVPTDHLTIAEGLAAAAFGDTVQVAPGTYFEHDLVMPDGVVLRGETGQSADVIIDAQQLGRVLFCDNLGSATSVENLTITGGFCDGDTSDGVGGGVLCAHSTVNFRGCAFESNYALVGGGMSAYYDCDMLIEDCIFRGNNCVSSGGGLRLYQSAPTLRRCQFIDNVAEMDGAGIFSGSSAMLLEDCLFAGNEAGIWGGAMVLISPNNGDLIVRGCTMVDNVAIWSGSAIFAANESPFFLENCIILGNRESEALYVHDDPAYESIACNNFFDNEDGHFGGNLPDQIGLNGNISLFPVFCDPTESDYHLSAQSPCLPENNDCGVLMGAFGMGCDLSTVPISSVHVPDITAFPNPFNPATIISFELPAEAGVRLSIHTLDGRQIAVLLDRKLTAGPHQVSWRGNDGQGRMQSAGVYLYCLDTPWGRTARKVTLIP
jgi:hypothetical protein